ncbi:histone-lysine N-methyltransferase SETMAR-like [Harpegnathos saltator]|uniref:histone-lysine N-methyltransferase SETMAR-like n=1 Tax=Harpegnathos saltator TaxID=610380 RepID=UPI000DBED28C|nr:histone-lysine N-methyltransferase SETMAR-like [Harpegnathos saltator]
MALVKSYLTMHTSHLVILYCDLKCHYDQREKAEQAAKKIYAVNGPNTVSNATAKWWFQRFRSGNMDVEDETRSSKSIVENVDKIVEIVESDRHTSTYSIAQELKISQKTVWNHLHKRMVAGDEKWVTYENNRRKRSWSKRGELVQTIVKPGLTARKVLLLKKAIDEKRPELANRKGVVFYQDNARPHISLTTRQKL